MSTSFYVDLIPQPAPVTTGSGIQSYKDPNGDLWVAKVGVRGGGWRRPYDVLRARVHRGTAAAALVAATWTNYTFDTTTWDEYGLLVLNNANVFTCPLAGFWGINAAFSANGVYGRILSGIYVNNTEVARGQDCNANALMSMATDVIPLNLNDTVQYKVYGSVATTLTAGSQVEYFTVEYHGPPTGS